MPRATHRPQDILFTLFGEYFLDRPDPVWVGALIELLHSFDLSEGAVRTALSRMSQKGWLVSSRRGRNAFYDLSEKGTRLLEEGKERIFHPPTDRPWDGKWFLLAYSIPEEQRHLRDRMRTRLAWLGCGSVGNGLWISPHAVADPVLRIARHLGITDRLEMFEAHRLGGGSPHELVAKCWDLPAIHERYQAFIGRWAPRVDECRTRLRAGDMSDADCFALRFHLIHEYQSFPLEDPFLPKVLLPGDWAGECASEMVHALHDLLAGPAEAHVDEVLRRAPAPPVAAGGVA
ncbi:MAG: phenylacetic acid degradation operon negative regulatory protein PaaX [Gemmatimonadota bacterium]|nr:phenylacetic acid degradation operon negative regulatory protein PaaX [Gemmatimonadota bacterium]MDH5760536.1 phenylacetic acid degradation operon negative regulatory protein PaaX [Gemmatimonadota bacterium]